MKKKKKLYKKTERNFFLPFVCIGFSNLIIMAPPLHAWRRYPRNTQFNPRSMAAQRLNTGFAASPRVPPKKKKLASLKGRVGKKGMMAIGAVPLLAGLGTLLGTLLNKKKKTQKKQTTSQKGGTMAWRVGAHRPFLLHVTSRNGWGRGVRQANAEQLRALTDVIRNVYDAVIPVPTHIKLPLKKHKREIRRLSAFSTPLYERRALLLSLGKRLVPFVRAGLDALQR